MSQLQQTQAGQRMTPQQLQLFAHNKLMHAMQTQPSAGQAGGQQGQGGQSVQQQLTQQVQSQQHQLSNAQLQATMMGKMQMQMGPQIHIQQGHVQGVVGGQGQTPNLSPAQIHTQHFQQPQAQHHSPIPRAQHVGQQKTKPTAIKKGPAGR